MDPRLALRPCCGPRYPSRAARGQTFSAAWRVIMEPIKGASGPIDAEPLTLAAIGQLAVRGDTAALIRALSTSQAKDSLKLRKAILWALVRIRDPASRPALLSTINDDPARQAKRLASHALVGLADASTVPFLADQLRNNHDLAGPLGRDLPADRFGDANQGEAARFAHHWDNEAVVIKVNRNAKIDVP